MPPELGSRPVQPQYREKMNKLAAVLDAIFNVGDEPQTGFILMVFPFGLPKPGEPEHRTNYISNARREDVVNVLKEQLSYFQGMSDQSPGGRA